MDVTGSKWASKGIFQLKTRGTADPQSLLFIRLSEEE